MQKLCHNLHTGKFAVFLNDTRSCDLCIGHLTSTVLHQVDKSHMNKFSGVVLSLLQLFLASHPDAHGERDRPIEVSYKILFRIVHRRFSTCQCVSRSCGVAAADRNSKTSHKCDIDELLCLYGQFRCEIEEFLLSCMIFRMFRRGFVCFSTVKETTMKLNYDRLYFVVYVTITHLMIPRNVIQLLSFIGKYQGAVLVWTWKVTVL